MRPDRHSFVQIAPQWRALVLAGNSISDEAADLVEAWRLAGRLLVVAASRADDPPESIRLGLATPAKARIGLPLAREAVLDISPPPRLEEARRAAPPSWHALLDEIARKVGRHDAQVAVYGSLAWQTLSGEPFVRPGSDIDLLITCGREAAPTGLFADLASSGESPRLDGEWCFGPSMAASWREYASAPQDILVKGHGGPWLWPLSRLHNFRSPET